MFRLYNALTRKKEGCVPLNFSSIWIYMDLLNIELASSYPRVSHHIEEIIKVVAGLIDKGYAYKVSGDVYFEVAKLPQYGRLSNRPNEARLVEMPAIFWMRWLNVSAT